MEEKQACIPFFAHENALMHYNATNKRYNAGRDHFVRQLEELMQSAPDDRIRNQLRKTISDANNTPE